MMVIEDPQFRIKDMDETTFRTRMMSADHNLNAGDIPAALADAETLRVALLAEPVVDGDQHCWALYYTLRAQHGLERWADVVALMEEYGALLSPIGPQNHAFGASLTMEAAVRVGRFDLLPKWAATCFVERLRTGDKTSFQQAVQTALALADMALPSQRTERRAEVFDALAQAAEQVEMRGLAGQARDQAAELRGTTQS
jgi:hypothetical protein